MYIHVLYVCMSEFLEGIWSREDPVPLTQIC